MDIKSAAIKAAIITGSLTCLGAIIAAIIGLGLPFVEDYLDKSSTIITPTAFTLASTEPQLANTLHPITTTESDTDFVAPSHQNITIDDLDFILGEGQWHCVDGYPQAVSINNVPENFVVQSPFTRVDKGDAFYYPGDSVPSGGYATGWLESIIPNNTCSLTQPDISQNDINTIFGNGNWSCLTQYPTGIKVVNFPKNYTVESPVVYIDKLDVRYYKGQIVPSGGSATAWFPNEIPTNECP